MNAPTITPSPPVQEQIIRESKVILKGVSWQIFQALLADVGDDRAWRIAYDSGVLEIRMLYLEHEVPKRLLESLVECIADELEIEVMSVGSLLLEREDLSRAIEPDTCFYIQNEALVRNCRDIDFGNRSPAGFSCRVGLHQFFSKQIHNLCRFGRSRNLEIPPPNSRSLSTCRWQIRECCSKSSFSIFVDRRNPRIYRTKQGDRTKSSRASISDKN
jgi:hypothetical protein